jgi:hypothetical protein
MQNYTIWEWFNRDHRGWLVSRFWRAKHVLKRDIKRVLENDPDALSEPIVVALLEAQQNGTLARKRGRNSYNFGKMAYVMLAQEDMRRLAKRLTRERARRPSGEKKHRGELSPTSHAAERVARKYNMGSGESFLRRISLQRKLHPYFCD